MQALSNPPVFIPRTTLQDGRLPRARVHEAQRKLPARLQVRALLHRIPDHMGSIGERDVPHCERAPLHSCRVC